MNRIIRIIAFCLIFFAFAQEGSARHIIGGDMSYTCLSQTPAQVTLRFEVVLYRDQRDPEGAQCDDDAEFGVWRGREGAWVYIGKTSPRAPQQGFLNELLNPPCADAGGGTSANIPPNEQCVYTFDIDLAKIDENYLITYQRCCRNAAITNVINAQEYGAVFSMELTPAGIESCNNSPKFTDYKTAIFCTNQGLTIDNFAADIDGDSVVYAFCEPISAGGQESRNALSCNYVKPDPELCGPEVFRIVEFNTPTFTFDKPLPSRTGISLNEANGLLEATPNGIGEYVMAICAEEYRDGVLLTKMRRDLQVIITSCEPKDAKLSVSPDDQPFVLNTGPNGELPGDPDKPLDDVFIVRVCGQTSVEFDLNNRSTPYSTESFKWVFDLGSEIVESDEARPEIDFPGIGDYSGFMVIDPASPPCSDTARVEVTILPTVESNFELEFDNCRAGEITFEDMSTTLPKEADNQITAWEWDFGDGNTSSLRSPSHFYTTPGRKNITMTVFDNNGCSSVFSRSIDWFPVPEPRVGPDGFLGCSPQSFFFENLSTPIDSNYTVEWDFGDGSDGPERFDISPSHTYTEPGSYDVSLSIKSPVEGCEENKKFKDLIEVLQGFEASFDMFPDEPKLISERVQFSNTSELGALNYVWDFGGRDVSFEENPVYTIRDTGVFVVTLTATWENGCSSSASREFEIVPCIEMRFPNAFTPNGDGRNEEFRGVVYGFSVENYHMTIFDRWGKLIFETNDPDEGWNGKYRNSGNDLPPGVYMYKVGFANPACDVEPKPGFATLIR